MSLPRTASTQFYTASARAVVAPAYQPLVNALPLPDPNAPLFDPTCDNITNPCQATISAAYSDPSNLNATSIRIDHNPNKKITMFGRYNHAPSYDATRRWEEIGYSNVTLDTATAGIVFTFTPNMLNDFRANWSKSSAVFTNTLTDFHGAIVPPTPALFPSSSPYSPSTGQALVYFTGNMEVRLGRQYADTERQVNFVDTYSWAHGLHQFRFGIDYRRLKATDGGKIRMVSFRPSSHCWCQALQTLFSWILAIPSP